MPAQNLVSRSASGKILRRKRIVLTIGEFGAAAVRLSARTIIKAESVAVFAALLGSVVILQVLAGAYASGFGGYPDEPAHLVSSLMVRDFLAGLDFRHPWQFAQQYYFHYPKVAIGVWPPGFMPLSACGF
jgi:hypothetical protein